MFAFLNETRKSRFKQNKSKENVNKYKSGGHSCQTRTLIYFMKIYLTTKCLFLKIKFDLVVNTKGTDTKILLICVRPWGWRSIHISYKFCKFMGVETQFTPWGWRNKNTIPFRAGNKSWTNYVFPQWGLCDWYVILKFRLKRPNGNSILCTKFYKKL